MVLSGVPFPVPEGFGATAVVPLTSSRSQYLRPALIIGALCIGILEKEELYFLNTGLPADVGDGQDF